MHIERRKCCSRFTCTSIFVKNAIFPCSRIKWVMVIKKNEHKHLKALPFPFYESFELSFYDNFWLNGSNLKICIFRRFNDFVKFHNFIYKLPMCEWKEIFWCKIELISVLGTSQGFQNTGVSLSSAKWVFFDSPYCAHIKQMYKKKFTGTT